MGTAGRDVDLGTLRGSCYATAMYSRTVADPSSAKDGTACIFEPPVG
jgi:hypothetical protein